MIAKVDAETLVEEEEQVREMHGEDTPWGWQPVPTPARSRAPGDRSGNNVSLRVGEGQDQTQPCDGWAGPW